MRGGYPVHLVHRLKYSWPHDYPPTKQTIATGTLEEEFWCVSTKLIGDCGHKHPTQESAQECMKPMKEKYRATRWPKKLPANE